MATIYSTRFVNNTVGPGSGNLYTVPVGFVAVLRSIILLIQDSGARAQLILSVGGANILLHTAASANEFSTYDVRAVLNASEVLTYGVTTGTAGFFISGYLLQGP